MWMGEEGIIMEYKINNKTQYYPSELQIIIYKDKNGHPFDSFLISKYKHYAYSVVSLQTFSQLHKNLFY